MSTTTAADNQSAAKPSSSVSTNLALIQAELQRVEQLKESLLQQEQLELNKEANKTKEMIARWRAEADAPDNDALIKFIRNEDGQSPKGKRLTDLTLRQMKHVLSKGATIQATAKYFKLSEATVNTRKKAFGLVGRKHVKPVPIMQAIKGMPMV
jgi:hypothetical protein